MPHLPSTVIVTFLVFSFWFGNLNGCVLYPHLFRPQEMVKLYKLGSHSLGQTWSLHRHRSPLCGNHCSSEHLVLKSWKRRQCPLCRCFLPLIIQTRPSTQLQFFSPQIFISCALFLPFRIWPNLLNRASEHSAFAFHFGYWMLPQIMELWKLCPNRCGEHSSPFRSSGHPRWVFFSVLPCSTR